MKKIALILLLFLSFICYGISDYDQLSEVVNPWTGEIQQNGFTFDSNAMNYITYYYYGKTQTYDTSTPDYEIKAKEWMKSVEYFYQSGGGVKITSVVSTTIHTVQMTVFSETVKPIISTSETPKIKIDEPEIKKEEITEEIEKIEEKEIKKEKSNTREYQLHSDIEYTSFEIAEEKGTGIYGKAMYFITSANEKWIYGLKAFGGQNKYMGENNLSISLGGNLSYMLFENTSIGLDANYVKDDMFDDSGLSLNVYFMQRFYQNRNIIAYGLIYNTNKMDVDSDFANFALLYGFPIGKRIAFNIENIYSRNIKYDGEKLDKPDILNTGGTLSIYFTDSFSLNIGGSTTLLVEDYKAYTVRLGSRYLF